MKKFVISIGLLISAGIALYSQVVGISQLTSHPTLDKVYAGILEGLKECGYTDKVVTANAQGDVASTVQIAQRFVSQKVDLIIAIATPSAQSAVIKANPKGIPVIFATITDPLGAKLVETLEIPGNLASGTQNVVSMKKEVALMRRVLPDLGVVGVVMNPAEPNSGVLLKQLKEEAKKQGIQVIEAPVSNSAEVAQGAAGLVGKVDAIFLIQDNTVASALSGLLKVAEKEKVPVFAMYLEAVEAGALMGLAVNEFEVGRQTGCMAVRVLKGADIRKMPVEKPSKLELTINLETAKELGIKLDERLIKEASKVFP